MKATTTFAIVMFAVIAYAAALPARKSMVYLQQPAAQWYSGPQRLMYMRYVQPSSASQTHARSTQAAEVLVAGDSVATGTYLKDCDHEESDVAAAGPSIDASAAENVEVPSSVNALEVDVEDAAATTADEVNNVQEEVLSVAEAYPEEPAVEVEIEATGSPVSVESNDDEAKTPRELNFDNAEAPETPVYTDASAFPDEAEAQPEAVPATVPVPESVPEPEAVVPEQPAVEAAAAIDVGGAAVVATRRYTPANKKVYVELEQPAAADLEEDDTDAAVDDDNETPVEDDDTVAVEEEEDRIVIPVKPARRPAKKPLRPSKAAQPAPATQPTATKKAPLPAGTFFPINFGGTSGGAIAIANSFSTGEGGSATSHAIAYGSPDAARAAHSRGTKKH